MNLPKTTFLIFTINIIQILSTPKLTLAQSQFLYKSCGTTTYTPNSTYQSNLNTILHLISTLNTQITNGFYNFSVGHHPDRVSSLALCRGDVPPTTCRSCLQDASNWLLLPNVCPNQKEAFGYSGYCSIFITNETISNQVQYQTIPWYVTNTGNVAYNDFNNFNTTLYALMGELRNRAASGNSYLKYADGNMSLKGGQKIYGLVQCTPDLDKNNCMDCIDNNILDYLPKCCVSRTIKASEVKFAHPSCFARYALQPFFGVGNVPNVTLSAPQPSALIPNNGSNNITAVSKTRKRRNIKAISISISIGVSAILVIIFVFSILLRRKKLMGTKPRTMVKFSREEMKALQSLQFSLGTIKYATRNFCDDNKIGEGGFGTVYKGKLPKGQEIAVKRLVRNKGQGDAEFKNEILILAGLRHKNLVKFEGFCLHRKEMILIYELVPNKSLDNFIFDPLKRSSMLWETRYKIINGIARGILYLHETSRLNIIHRDLKAANVLLDEDFNPKIADFGMARLFDIDQTQAILASKVVGTLGYIAPEYALHRQVSVKSDVYSFGVLVLEIISGQKISSFQTDEENHEPLLNFAWRNWIKGTPHNLVDPTLASTGSSFEILRCIHIGLLCVQANPSDRPTMSSIDLMLSSNSVTLEVPSQPAFYTESKCLPNMLSNWSSAISDESSSKSAIVSINDVSITELHPR